MTVAVAILSRDSRHDHRVACGLGIHKQARYCGVGEDEAETSIELWLHGLPPPPGRWAIVGAAATGMIGAIAGLVIGLRTDLCAGSSLYRR